MSAHPHAVDDTQHAKHPSTGTYVTVAVILSVITGLEFAVIYIRRLTPILIPLLLTLSAGKFALVVMFFMHLRYDRRSLTFLFVAPLILAVGLAVALTTLFGDFLVFKR